MRHLSTTCCPGDTPVGVGILSHCTCDSNTTCCPGDTLATNPTHCTCDSNTECCPGDTLATNPTHCTCDSNTECCPGDTLATNPTHCTCDSNTECCPGDTLATNPTHCTCDSNTECCPGDTLATNPTHCTCDSNTECCPEDTPATNPTHCQTECVRLNGTACCPQSLGGTCTGRWCIQSGTQCNYWGRCHIKDPGDGICRPSCGHLINSGTELKYKHHGLDCKIFSGDEPRGMQREKTCADLNVINYLGGNNWKRAPEVGGVGGHEEITIGGECCVRDIDLPMSVSDLRASCRDYWLCYRGAVNENINREHSSRRILSYNQ